MAGRPTTYLALLRGINNAGNSARVAMTDLRALFESLGFGDVRTLLNSGNVVFSAREGRRGDVGARIEKALASRLGLTIPVILLSAGQVAAAVRGNPLSHVSTNPSHLLVLVPKESTALPRLKALLKERWAPEALAVGNGVAYLWCAKGVAKSPLWTAVDHALERTGTARNIATLTKALALIEAQPA
jgi:uncharacterized protein (DUF1697 family)